MAATLIIIDDDPINNFIIKKNVELVDVNTRIFDFTDPKQGLDFIRSGECLGTDSKTIVLLDLNISPLNGWELLKQMTAMDKALIQKLNIYILSSSVDIGDRMRAKIHPLVKDFLVKPIDVDSLMKIL